MSEARSDLERLLALALRPVEPPEGLPARVESTLLRLEEALYRVTAAAAGELEETLSALSAAASAELSAEELRALRDPRNWVRPAVALGVGATAATALFLLQLRRQRRPSGLRGLAAEARSRIGS